jgi:hypothetical protein
VLPLSGEARCDCRGNAGGKQASGGEMNTDLGLGMILAFGVLSAFVMLHSEAIGQWCNKKLKRLADRHQSKLRVEWSPRVEAWRRFQQVEVIRKDFSRQKSPVVIRTIGSTR